MCVMNMMACLMTMPHLNVVSSDALWSCQAGDEPNDRQPIPDLLGDLLEVISEASTRVGKSHRFRFLRTSTISSRLGEHGRWGRRLTFPYRLRRRSPLGQVGDWPWCWTGHAASAGDCLHGALIDNKASLSRLTQTHIVERPKTGKVRIHTYRSDAGGQSRASGATCSRSLASLLCCCFLVLV